MLTLDINLKNRATTQYVGHDFNSMVKFNGRYLGASGAGLFDLAGDLDNSAKIDAYFEPIVTDMGVPQLKRMRFFYFGYESNGSLKLTVQADEGNSQDFTVDSRKAAQQARRVPARRDLYGRYWMFRISNVNGSDFSVDALHVLPVLRALRHE